ncbi:P-selectin glycoprotein ligand 1 [Salarias fasciatus]|uniref:P-selectin glycoprotein ligand 1 n=1 Tax=Salarias fasciatus TaxID=181472 RepID=UPI0011764AA8|nr:P-selectin glycoprotein ligand 1 [Salarias fasciatus]
MMLISTKVCVALLWGLCVFSAVESESVDTPENKNSTENSTAPWNTSNVPNNEEETTAATRAPSQKPTEVSAATEAASRMSATEETDEKQAATSTSSGNAAGLTAMSTAAAATAAANTPSVRPILSSTAATTADRAAPSSQSATGVEGIKQTEGQHEQSSIAATSVDNPATTSTALHQEAFSTQRTAVTEPERSSESSPTASSSSEIPIFIQESSTPSVSSASTGGISPTSGAAPVIKTTSTSSRMSESPISTELSHTSRSSSMASSPPSSSSSSSSAAASTLSEAPSSTAAFSTSPAALVPLGPKKRPDPQTEPPPATTAAAPRDVTKTTPGTEVQACSTRAVMKHCLIVIASLAALATIFIMSTIVLCVKLSAKKYRVKRSQEGTEMMCISALLPDRSYNYTRQRNPVPNGVLVIPRAGDSDEEGGDTVTLSSFLPENDRYV